MGDVDAGELTRLWQLRWPECPPIADSLRCAYPERWVRFHSLPGSKRYADSEAEYRIILERHNAVIGELDPGPELIVITCDWTATPNPSAPEWTRRREVDPDGVHWKMILQDPDDDPEFRVYVQLYASRRSWAAGAVDGLLRAVADDELGGVILAPPELAWLYHPYDGGADVIMPSRHDRDVLKAHHRSWLSTHRLGL